MDTLNILSNLLNTPSISGNEKALFSYISELFCEAAPVSLNGLNSIVIGPIGNKSGKKIIIDAHCDQIGFVVSHISESGFVKLSPVGSIDERVLSCQRVKIYGKETVSGVFSSIPPHLQKSGDSKSYDSLDNMWVDTLGFKNIADTVSLGDPAAFDTKPMLITPDLISGCGIDNKAGCAAVISAFIELCKTELKNSCVELVLSSQEEVGCRSVRAAAYDFEPDEAIVVDVSFAHYPACPKAKCGEIKKGAMLGLSPVLSKAMREAFVNAAEADSIPFQSEILPELTGTNADLVSNAYGSVKTALLSIPIKNMHTAAELCSLTDIENTARLIKSYIERGDINA